MNKWAIGLTAIGWSFSYGSNICCPAHRPDPIPCTDDSRDENGAYMTRGKACASCRADQIAEMIQHAIIEHHDQLVVWDAERRLGSPPEHGPH